MNKINVNNSIWLPRNAIRLSRSISISPITIIAINTIIIGLGMVLASIFGIRLLLPLGAVFILLGLLCFPSLLVGYMFGGYYLYYLALEYSGLTSGNTILTTVYFALLSIMVLFSLLFHRYRTGNPPRVSDFFNADSWVLIVFVVYIIIQYVLLSNTSGATKKLGFLIIMSFPAFLVGRLLDRSTALRCLKIALVFAVFLGFYAIFKTLQNPINASPGGRVTAMTTFNYHGQTYVLSCGAIIFMSLFFFRNLRYRFPSILYLMLVIYMVVFVIDLIMAVSRGGITGFVAVTITMLIYILIYKHTKKNIKYILLSITIILAIIMISSVLGLGLDIRRLKEMKQIYDLAMGNVSESDTGVFVSSRLDLIKDQFSLFVRNPVFGFGFGNAESFLYVHNYFLEVLFETGIIGASLLIWIFYKTIKNAIVILKKSVQKIESEDNLLVTFVFIFLYYSIVGLFSGSLFDSYHLWFCIGAIWNPHIKPSQGTKIADITINKKVLINDLC